MYLINRPRFQLGAILDTIPNTPESKDKLIANVIRVVGLFTFFIAIGMSYERIAPWIFMPIEILGIALSGITSVRFYQNSRSSLNLRFW